MPIAAHPRNVTSACSPHIMSNFAVTAQVGLTIKNNYDLRVSIHDIGTKAVLSQFDLSNDANAVSGMNLPINPDPPTSNGDGHWDPGVLWDADGYIWITGNNHSKIGYGLRPNGGINLIRSTNANDITAWTDMTTSYPPAGWPVSSPGVSATGANIHTYTHFDRMPDGTSLWWLSQEESLAGSRGRDWLGFYKPKGTINTWTPLVGQGEFTTSEADTPQGTTADRVYISAVVIEERQAGPRLHVIGQWRLYDQYSRPDEGGPGTTNGQPSSMKPWYIYSDDYRNSSSWKRADGTTQSMPVTWSNSGAITNDGATINTWNADGNTYVVNYGSTMTVDSNGRPHWICDIGENGGMNHHWWNGSAWQHEAVASDLNAITPFPFKFRDKLYACGAIGFNVFIKGVTNNTIRFRHGGPLGDPSFSSHPDPIRLRQEWVDLMVPDGDNPAIYSFGHHRHIRVYSP